LLLGECSIIITKDKKGNIISSEVGDLLNTPT
jgi:hypothetical protein